MSFLKKYGVTIKSEYMHGRNDRQSQEIQYKKIGRTAKSADLSKDFQLHNEGIIEKDKKTENPYVNPKLTDRKSESKISDTSKLKRPKKIDEYTTQVRVTSSAPISRQESKIPIYTGVKFHSTEMNNKKNARMPMGTTSTSRWGYHRDTRHSSSDMNQQQKHKISLRNTSPSLNYGYSHQQLNRSLDNVDSEIEPLDNDSKLEMIFKYCVWPEVAKDEPNGKVLGNGTVTSSELPLEPPTGKNLSDGLLGCCPCFFRSRRSIGIDSRNVSELSVGGHAARTATPIFAVKSDDSRGTM
ncbi:PREDICTED: uncharacterized protein LOC105364259 [Ceratosolen solmsi marchali]|uniref:Uncharacterized protein LOC105364259 n=1 Tax=Ceratosolen solmsi marchali TaxID=326594 RepID=A0AAJ6YLV1_9HYME|nr:PREDICTED: uncharacterized protein LOC105364259 [Ceratosolen solmsi marchali]